VISVSVESVSLVIGVDSEVTDQRVLIVSRMEQNMSWVTMTTTFCGL